MKKTITVVTGGHGGMGKAICKELGKTSAIVLAGRNLAKMETAKAELDELGVESHLCKTNIADRAQVQALADYINGVDILADGGQNAGIFVPQI